MKDVDFSSINYNKEDDCAEIIDQRFLPFGKKIVQLKTVSEVAAAIKDMYLRGAPLIGIAAAFGVYFASKEFDTKENIYKAIKELQNTRPTAVNLIWALKKQKDIIKSSDNIKYLRKLLLQNALKLRIEDAAMSKAIGLNGLKLIEEIYENKKDTVNILTHCNAGALATVQYGTATAPVYMAKEKGVPVHVWVEETRPRNQGKLTAFELSENNIDCTVICDNSGGHIMQHDMVDIVIVGSDRVAANGDIANKIGTYLKALSAHDNNIPFYVAFPSSTIDFSIENGLKDIPIEERSEDEVLFIDCEVNGKIEKGRLFHKGAKAVNYGFDVTPAKYITGFITELGVFKPDELSKIHS